MMSSDRLRDVFSAMIEGVGPGLSLADRLCLACVELLDVDGAAISVMHEGAVLGTFGSSGELSRRLDEFQFTFGEGPCLDSVRQARPVFVSDLRDPRELRWPVYSGAVLEVGVRAVYALPVSVADACVGALDLYRNAPGFLSGDLLAGGLLAAELAALPLLDVLSPDVDWAESGDDGQDGSQPVSLARVEIYQATGMVMVQLGVGPGEALVRLRGYAFAHGMTASETAWAIVERRLSLADDSGRNPA